jgi:hypothetical protein
VLKWNKSVIGGGARIEQEIYIIVLKQYFVTIKKWPTI